MEKILACTREYSGQDDGSALFRRSLEEEAEAIRAMYDLDGGERQQTAEEIEAMIGNVLTDEEVEAIEERVDRLREHDLRILQQQEPDDTLSDRL